MSVERALLEWRDAALSYDRETVLTGLNWDLRRGQRIALLGASGAGKSTLLSALYRHLSAAEPVAWIPQDLGLVPNLSAFHNVYMGRLDQEPAWRNLLNLLWPQVAPRRQIRALLARLELEPALFRAVGKLSGGQRQRVAIARALYRRTAILLADEPVTGLDPPRARACLEALREGFGTAVVALHDADLALSFADRVLGLAGGRIALDVAADGITAADLQALYRHERHHRYGD